jgi:hypothetical protein
LATPQLISWNVASLYGSVRQSKNSAGKNKHTPYTLLRYKKALLHHDLHSLLHPKGGGKPIVCLQECKLKINQTLLLRQAYPEHRWYFNSLAGNRAGTATAVPVDYFQHYDSDATSFTIIQQGYLSCLQLVPKLGNGSPRFAVYNVYTATSNNLTKNSKDQVAFRSAWGHYNETCVSPTQADTLSRRRKYHFDILAQDLRSRPPGIDVFLAGDFNPTCDSKLSLAAFTTLLTTFFLTEIKQPLPTYIAPNKNGVPTLSKLDFFYTNLTEADLTIVQPDSYLAPIDFGASNITANLALANTVAAAAGVKATSFPDEEGKEVPRHPSDHLPVCLTFKALTKTKPKVKPLYHSTLENEHYQNTFWELAKELPLLDCPYQDLKNGKNLLFHAQEVYLRKHKRDTKRPPNTQVTNATSLLTGSIKLYREATKLQPRTQILREVFNTYPELRCYNTIPIPIDKIKAFANAKIYATCQPANPHPPPPTTPLSNKRQTNIINEIKRQLPSQRRKVCLLQETQTSPVIDDPDGLSQLIAQHWGNIWKPHSSDEDHIQSFLNAYNKRVKHIHRITLRVLTRAIHLASNNSSAGPDGVPFAAYKIFAEFYLPKLLAVATALGEAKPPPPWL